MNEYKITISRTAEGNVCIQGVTTPDDIVDYTYAIIKWFSKNLYLVGMDENKICEHLVKMVARATEETKPNETDTRTVEHI